MASRSNPFPIHPWMKRAQTAQQYITRMGDICNRFDPRGLPLDVELTVQALELCMERLKAELAAIKPEDETDPVNKPDTNGS